MARTLAGAMVALLLVCMAHPAEAEEFRITDAPLDTTNFDGFALLDGDLYYGVRDDAGDRSTLIHVDEESGAWRVAASIPDSGAPLHIREVEILGDAVYFISAPQLKYFGTLWKYTPATDALEAVKQFDTVAPRELEPLADRLILATWATSRERSGLWRSDGTAAGTLPIGTGFVPENLRTEAPYVYFTSLGTDFYRAGANGGVLKIAGGINFRDSVNRRLLEVVLYNFRIYFLASAKAGEPLQLWSTDGSMRNTRQETFLSAPPRRPGKEDPPVSEGGAAGGEPPYLGIIDDALVFSVPDYPFYYFYRYNPEAPDGTNAEPITSTPVTFLLPFDDGLILAGPVEVDRRQVLFVGNGTISDINANFGLGRVPGPLLSNRASAYFVDVSAVQLGGDPSAFTFPLYRIRSGTGLPVEVDTGEALAGKILGAAAAVTDTVAYTYLLDPTGQEPVRLTQIVFADEVPEGEGEGAPEGEPEGAAEGEAPDPEELLDLAQRILDRFVAVDTDSNGAVSEAELSVAGINYTVHLYRALDTNGNSALSREELTAAGAVETPSGCGCINTTNGWRELLGDLLTFALTAAALLLLNRWCQAPFYK